MFREENEDVAYTSNILTGQFKDQSSFIWLFVLRLNVPVNKFSVMLGGSQRFLGFTSNVGS